MRIKIPVLLTLLSLTTLSCTSGSDVAPRTYPSNDVVQRACALHDRYLTRIWRGYSDASEDITIVPQAPNYSGTFTLTSHSGPWDYLQRVPLVFYGPGIVSPQGATLEEPAGIVDVFPTVGQLLDVDLPRRAGRVLPEVQEADARRPKLIVVVVWDGAGRNVLQRWPESWPTLARMESEGTSYINAVVGSSPSITPATHSSLGTGGYPKDHGVAAIKVRRPNGEVVYAFNGTDPSELRLSTFGDEVDQALGNEPQVGGLAWVSWHLGMMSHGSQMAGGDEDQVAFLRGDFVRIPTQYYTAPDYLSEYDGPDEQARELDREDGEQDGLWMGHAIQKQHDNPAWVRWQTEVLLRLLREEGYGSDAVPDLFFTNYKMSDIAGHRYSIGSREVEAVIRAQDEALGELLRHLDEEVRDYVVIVTADHGHTLSPKVTGAWPISQRELRDDLNAHFDVPKDRSLVVETTAVGFFVDHETARDLGVTGSEMARFLNDYTIGDNAKGGEDTLPEGFEERADENVFSAAFPRESIPEVMRCAFGRPEPPAGARG